MPDRPYIVTSTKQLLALASPMREEILDAVGVVGPCGVTELAKFLGRSRNALYHHIRVLRDLGLLLETEVEGNGTKPTAFYDVPGRPVIVKYDVSTPRTRRAVMALGRARMRAGERGFVRACDPAVAVVEGPHRNLWATHWKGWFTKAELARANELLNELVELFKHNGADGGGEREAYEVTFAVAPMMEASAKKKRTPTR